MAKQIKYNEYPKEIGISKQYHSNTWSEIIESSYHGNEKVSSEMESKFLWNTDLSQRAINVCKLHDFNGRKSIEIGNLLAEDFKPLATIGDLCKWTKEELMELQNCGPKTIVEFEVLLAQYNRTLQK